jgi:[ribosomal protein S5]-alanine N-acetyltransferase
MVCFMENRRAALRTLMIVTARLKLVPATVAHVRAEIGDRVEFAKLIQAEVPENWPPESAADALPLFLKWLEAAGDQVGWFGWYALAQADGANAPMLVGSCGFLGPPRDGEVKVGYSVLPRFQRRGLATEMVGGLVRWALQQPGVNRIVAETEWENPASVRVLMKLGFVAVGSSANGQGARFELSRRP